MCCVRHKKKHDTRELGLFKEELRCSEMLCFCTWTFCCYARTTLPPISWFSAAKVSIGEYWSRVAMALCTSVTKFLMREWKWQLQTKVTEKRITKLQLMNKLNQDNCTVYRKICQRTMDFTHWTCNYIILSWLLLYITFHLNISVYSFVLCLDTIKINTQTLYSVVSKFL